LNIKGEGGEQGSLGEGGGKEVRGISNLEHAKDKIEKI